MEIWQLPALGIAVVAAAALLWMTYMNDGKQRRVADS